MTFVNMLLMLCLVCLIFVCCGSSSLFTTRVLSELRDINKQRLSLSDPFNDTKSDCGIRLSPKNNNNLQIWHFSFTGVEGSAFEGGIYHGIIKLPKDYPRKAPSVSLSTHSGRWKINEEICLSASSHHQELWNPDWNLRTLVLSLRGFMITPPFEVGGLMASIDERVRLARLSRNWVCPECGVEHATLCGDSESISNTAQNNQLQRHRQTPLSKAISEKSTLKKKKGRHALIQIGVASAVLSLLLYYGVMV